MAEIKYQFPGDRPEISGMEIHIPNLDSHSQRGTGMFTTMFAPKAFSSGQPIASTIGNPPVFGITASVDPDAGIHVAIFEADPRRPRHRIGFVIPAELDAELAHTLVIEFANWKILSAAIDGAPLATLERMKGH